MDSLQQKKLEASIGRANACILEYEVKKLESLNAIERMDGEIARQKELIQEKKQQLAGIEQE